MSIATIALSGFLLKAALIGTDTVAFDSDEAVVGLMAKHILAGERPVFFYGQTYMGSLDAYLTAVSFHLLGVSVFSMRLVQLLLFALLILSTYRLALRLYGDEATAQIAALLTALPPSLLSLYTTITLGGYLEILLLGTWALHLGHQVTHEAEDSWLQWGLLGFVGGLGFWTLPMMAVYLIPVAIAVLLQWHWRRSGRYAVTIIMFILATSPWWIYCLAHTDTCLQPFTTPIPAAIGGSGWLATLARRIFGFLALGLTALWGLRHPWLAQPVSLVAAVPVIVIYLGSLLIALRRPIQANWLPLALAGTFLLVFLCTPYGNDPSGRYLLPLYLPMVFLVAYMLRRLWGHSRGLAVAGLVTLLAFNVGTTFSGARAEPAGMTAQLDARFQFGNQHDADLITFLKEQDEHHGYSHYWVAFKITFLSDEEIIIASVLPFKVDLAFDAVGNRYPPYGEQVRSSPTPPFYITSNQPALDELLRGSFTARRIGYQEQTIGPYRVFYNLSSRISPDEIESYGSD